MTEGTTAIVKKSGASGHGPGVMVTQRKKKMGRRCDQIFPGRTVVNDCNRALGGQHGESVNGRGYPSHCGFAGLSGRPVTV